MKKIISLALCLMLLVCTFCACGKKDAPAANPYDTNTYSLSNAIEGVSFLYPKEADTNLAPWSQYGSYTADVKEASYFEYTDAGKYCIFKPGKFAVYCFSVGTINHLEGKTDLKTLAAYLGINGFINFASRDNGGYTTQHVDDKYIKNVFPAIMRDTQTHENFSGYVTLIKRASDREVFVFAIGYTDNSHENMVKAKTMAEFFTLNEL